MTKIALILRAAVFSGIVVGLSACQSEREADQAASKRADEANRQLSVIQHVENTVTGRNVRTHDGIWVGSDGVKTGNGEPLPLKWEAVGSVVLASAKPLSLVEIADKIGEITGILVRDADQVMTGELGVSGNGATQPVGADSTGAAPAAGSPLSAGDQDFQGDPFLENTGTARDASPFLRGTPRFPPMPVKYTGTLSGLLNKVAVYYGIDWEYRNGVVRFVGVQTRTYTLAVHNASTDITTSIANTTQGGSQSGGGGGGQSTSGASGATASSITTSIKDDYWKNVKAIIASIVPSTAVFAINQDEGTITVTGDAAVQRRVDGYIRDENRRVSRQVAIDVNVYSVTVSDSDDYNLNLAAAFKSLNGGWGAAVTPLASVNPSNAPSEGSLGASIVSAATKYSQEFNGSSAVVQALAKIGKVALVKHTNVVTENNKAAPVSALRQIGYVQSTQSTVTGTTGTAQASIQPGTINTGFMMNVTPRIFSTGDILINYSITLSNLVDLQNFTSGSGANANTVQLPTIDIRSFTQNVRLGTGETLVLSGYEATDNEHTKGGMGWADNLLFGGSSSSTNQREMIVVVMTPTIIESTRAISAN